MNSKIKLAFTGFLQVFFVAINTFFIANLFYSGILIAAFLISYIWTLNIKAVAFGTQLDRLVYSGGAMVGSVLGAYISSLLLK
jgi:hypothetical protein